MRRRPACCCSARAPRRAGGAGTASPSRSAGARPAAAQAIRAGVGDCAVLLVCVRCEGKAKPVRVPGAWLSVCCHVQKLMIAGQGRAPPPPSSRMHRTFLCTQCNHAHNQAARTVATRGWRNTHIHTHIAEHTTALVANCWLGPTRRHQHANRAVHGCIKHHFARRTQHTGGAQCSIRRVHDRRSHTRFGHP